MFAMQALILYARPLSILSFATSGLFFFLLAILGDTLFYRPSASLSETLRAPIVTPLNNFLYNSDSSNLATHGLHSHYQHFVANLPQLLGPVYIMMIISLISNARTLTIPSWMKNMRAVSAISATTLLSIFPHQEPRFLLPCVPLLLSCFRVQTSRLRLGSWIIFNTILGLLMGVYHQGGVMPTQLAIPSILSTHPDTAATATVFWWKTYPPPLWLLGDTKQSVDISITTRDLMGIPGQQLLHHLDQALPSCPDNPGNQRQKDSIFVVAPKSATFLDQYLSSFPKKKDIQLHNLWTYTNHLNFDDLVFGSDGVFSTLGRVVGKRGLGVWVVRRGCPRSIEG